MKNAKRVRTQSKSGFHATTTLAFFKGRPYRVYVNHAKPWAPFIRVHRQMMRLPSDTPLVRDVSSKTSAPSSVPLQLNWDELSHADMHAARVALNTDDLHTLTQRQLKQLQTKYPSYVALLQTTPADITVCKQESVLFAKAMKNVTTAGSQACAKAAEIARDVKEYPNASAAFSFKAIAMLKRRADVSGQTATQLLPILFIKTAVDDMSASGVDVSACDIKLVIERAVQQSHAYLVNKQHLRPRHAAGVQQKPVSTPSHQHF